MKIKKLEIKGLHGNQEPLILNFNDDLNILSGRNGAGKTTILKLMWYLISGNFDKAVAEIQFTSAVLLTDKYELTVELNFDKKDQPFSSTLKAFELDITKLKGIDEDKIFRKIVQNESKTNMAWFFTQYIDSSFFMPTFRMIEGGFTTEKYNIKHDVIKEFYLNLNNENDFNDFENSLIKISNNLTKKDHKFITSISAKEIDMFLVKKYAEIMKKVNIYQSESLQLLSKKIKLMFDTELKDIELVESLNKRNTFIETEINNLNKPLNKIKAAVKDFMPFFRIQFDQKIYFTKVSEHPENKYFNSEGFDLDIPDYEFDHFDLDTTDIPSYDPEIDFDQLEFESLVIDDHKDKNITINNLSAGEKQLLTFVSYNIFHNDTIFFIDEPELSLHVDWQSKLFSLLKEQNPTNQFIISTHSPFIYSLFPDKELVMDFDKGCSEF